MTAVQAGTPGLSSGGRAPGPRSRATGGILQIQRLRFGRVWLILNPEPRALSS